MRIPICLVMILAGLYDYELTERTMVACNNVTEIFSTSEYQKTNMSIGFSIVDLVENQSLVGYGPHFH